MELVSIRQQLIFTKSLSLFMITLMVLRNGPELCVAHLILIIELEQLNDPNVYMDAS